MTAPPECAEAPKLCAACGANGGRLNERLGIPYWGGDTGNHLLCSACWATPSGIVDEGIRARRSQLTATPGSDTFECKICDKVTPCHLEHQTAAGTVVERGFCPTCFPIAQRQARLDSLAPTRAREPEAYEPMACCGRERDKDGGPNPHCECPASAKPSPSPTTCSECKAPAVLNGGLCVYCDYSTNEGKETRAGRDWLAGLRTSKDPRMVEPRKRLAAIEQKRPRVNAAERAMLERGHPASWPSTGDEEP